MSQSPELAAGEGFDFEDVVAAFYITKLFAQEAAPGMDGSNVSKVSVQQRDFGEPLDDVIVDFESNSGSKSRLSLQAKQSITVSAGATNKDFREVVRDSWKTFKKPDFRRSVDRFGVATEKIAEGKLHALRSLCESARASLDHDHFQQRFNDDGNANKEIRRIKGNIDKILAQEIDEAISAEDIHQFLSHFVIIRFDLMREGASGRPEAINAIKRCLADEEIAIASLVWDRFRNLAAERGGKSGQLDRNILWKEISPIAKLKGSNSIRSDAEKIKSVALNSISQIQDGIGAVYLERRTLELDVEKSLNTHRFVQIQGLPGSGKSVFLRRLVQKSLSKGPTFFLKSEGVRHSSWLQFAQSNGIETLSLEAFLLEFGTISEPIFYLDAIDRLETSNQPFIREILDVISNNENLSHWKVIVSLRDTGVEALQLWLGDILARNCFAMVEVGLLSDVESEELSKAKEHLRPLLFGPSEVRQIVRRPFFAKILDQGFIADQTSPLEKPNSEVELLEHWWKRGGFNEAPNVALPRQRTLIRLATAQCSNLSRPIPFECLDSVNEISGLLQDGILQEVETGVSVRFSHDIFFEWAFLYALRASRDGWISHIRKCGEPPAAARSVELLSQQKFNSGDSWDMDLLKCDDQTLRSQWLRAWLFGPFGSPKLTDNYVQIGTILCQNNASLLIRLLVWFQAEKTIPNPNVLVANIPSESVQLAAYEYSWPSDFRLWRNVIPFLLRLLPQVSSAVYPAALSVFEVWQNACSGFQNFISRDIIRVCSDWLNDMDTEVPDSNYFDKDSKWSKISEPKNFRDDLVNLLINASAVYPSHVESYLRRLIESDSIRDKRSAKVFENCLPLAKTMPCLLADLALSTLLKELPEEVAQRIANEGSHYSRFHSFGDYDWDKLSIEDDHRSFYPQSPLREPFKSLFECSPGEALRLLRELCKHATTAWRQLHRLDHSRESSPIPLKLEFPWGGEVFWGGLREYRYFRGVYGPNALSCGLMAAEKWAFGEVESGGSPDEVIRQLIEGTQCISILGIAAMIAMKSETISLTTLPIFTSQRLLGYDQSRKMEDQGSIQANLIGYWGNSGSHHQEALRALNQLPVRRRELREFIPAFVFGEESLSKRACELLLGLKENLPFEYEEHRAIESVQKSLMEDAKRYAELADRNNYKAYPVENEKKQIAIVHESPTASKPENIAKLEEINSSLSESYLASWALKSFEDGELGESFSIVHAVSIAKKAIAEGRLSVGENDLDEPLLGVRRGGIAGVAAVVLTFREGLSDDLLTWARQTIEKVIKIPEIPGQFWLPESIDPTHRMHSVAHAIAADIKNDTAAKESHFDLLALCAHPLDCVAETSMKECFKLWEIDPQLSWSALVIALDLCHLHPEHSLGNRPMNVPRHNQERVNKAVNEGFAIYRNQRFEALPKPPPAWVKGGKGRQPGRTHRRTGRSEKGITEWRAPEGFWNTKKVQTILTSLPLFDLVIGEGKAEFMSFIRSLVIWTKEKNSPSWQEVSECGDVPSEMIEWNHSLGTFLGELAGILPVEQVETEILENIIELEGEVCWSLLSGFVNSYICRYILDSEEIHFNAIYILGVCLTKFLEAPEIQSKTRGSDFRNFDDTALVRHFLFVSVEKATLASRFANGNWQDIGKFLPIIDKLITNGAHLMSVVEAFITLCERSKIHYPAQMFSDQILTVFDHISDSGRHLKKRFLTARIAELVQYFSQQETPMENTLAQRFLRILDHLVDFGDRRAAALQLNAIFREIRLDE